jgi:predicted nuclease with TOPRIM domain
MNNTLNLIDKIIKITERYAMNVANYLQYLHDNNSTGRYTNRIEIETNKLIELIGLHENLQEQFQLLIDQIKNLKKENSELNRGFSIAYHKYKDLELINKDPIELNKKIDYYKKAAKLMFDEITRLKHEQQNN